MTLAVVVACALIIVLIGIPLLILIGLFNLLCIMMAAVKASEGATYRYPLNLRLIK